MPDLGSYLFNLEPGPPDAVVVGLGIFFAVALVAGLAAYYFRKTWFRGTPYLWLAGTAGLWGITTGGLGILFVLAAVAGIPLFAARFWLVGLALIDLVVIAWLLYTLLIRIPRDRERYVQASVRQRYLPRPSGKKKSKGRKR